MSSTDERMIKVLEELKMICDELGWTLMLDMENEFFRGLVIGTEDYLVDVMENKEDFPSYTLLQEIEHEDKRVLH